MKPCLTIDTLEDDRTQQAASKLALRVCRTGNAAQSQTTGLPPALREQRRLRIAVRPSAEQQAITHRVLELSAVLRANRLAEWICLTKPYQASTGTKTGAQVSLQWRLRAKPGGVTRPNEQP